MTKRSRSPSPGNKSSPSPSPLPSTPTSPTASQPTKTISTPATTPPIMHCTLPPHRSSIPFTSYADYEVHYRQTHVNRCVECGRNFPTGWFLELHIAENHDPIAGARRERGEKTYACFIETCEKVCSTPKKRRLHLVDKHMFPRSYNFFIVNDGIDQQTSMLRSSRHRLSISSLNSNANGTSSDALAGRLRHRRVSSKLDSASAARTASNDDRQGVDEITASMSALRFVPPSVTKARGRSHEDGDDLRLDD